MYAVLLLGIFQVYSTQTLAEKNAASFIQKRLLNNYSRAHSAMQQEYTNAFNQERYSDCITIWNKFIQNDDWYCGNTMHMALISKMEIDKPFV